MTAATNVPSVPSTPSSPTISGRSRRPCRRGARARRGASRSTVIAAASPLLTPRSASSHPHPAAPPRRRSRGLTRRWGDTPRHRDLELRPDRIGLELACGLGAITLYEHRPASQSRAPAATCDAAGRRHPRSCPAPGAGACQTTFAEFHAEDAAQPRRPSRPRGGSATARADRAVRAPAAAEPSWEALPPWSPARAAPRGPTAGRAPRPSRAPAGLAAPRRSRPPSALP